MLELVSVGSLDRDTCQRVSCHIHENIIQEHRLSLIQSYSKHGMPEQTRLRESRPSTQYIEDVRNHAFSHGQLYIGFSGVQK